MFFYEIISDVFFVENNSLLLTLKFGQRFKQLFEKSSLFSTQLLRTYILRVSEKIART